VDAREAELIYLAGKDAVIKVLMEMDAKIQTLEQQVLALEKKIFLMHRGDLPILNSGKMLSAPRPKA
jgi:hypothetical protein